MTVLFEPKALIATEDKAEQIMESMLLQQYTNSPNLKEYMNCFLSELDLLFAETERVYLGRFLEYAGTEQLDIIGEIIGQSRAIALPNTWFGFTDDGTITIPGIAGFADEATPSEGGRLRDENVASFDVIPLDNFTYRRALAVKAMCNNLATVDVNTTYELLSTLLNKVPSTFELKSKDTVTTTVTTIQTIELIISISEVTQAEAALIAYMSRYFIPTGTTFIINRT